MNTKNRYRRPSERGASSVEYGFLIAGIAAMIVVIVFVFGQAISGSIIDTCDQISTSANNAAC